MVFLRACLVWLIIIATETVHGILRNLFLTPRIGDFRARQMGVFIGAALILLISIIFIRFLKTTKISQLIIIGLFWVALTMLFEIVLGRILGFSWNRILSDYNLPEGGLMPIGFVLMALSPLIAAYVRGLLKH